MSALGSNQTSAIPSFREEMLQHLRQKYGSLTLQCICRFMRATKVLAFYDDLAEYLKRCWERQVIPMAYLVGAHGEFSDVVDIPDDYSRKLLFREYTYSRLMQQLQHEHEQSLRKALTPMLLPSSGCVWPGASTRGPSPPTRPSSVSYFEGRHQRRPMHTKNDVVARAHEGRIKVNKLTGIEACSL
ncbi:hypothetical protein MRX96_006705 [Rhipicephalus microplus]|uniref:Uncharacterized protein n=1 Tax=Rhipicephalus microplus TaxID=6941 RepID=A0A9J6DC78_RHIMP|nr:hypothetical protein HPB51_020302 [Rhipicephalus microplus]